MRQSQMGAFALLILIVALAAIRTPSVFAQAVAAKASSREHFNRGVAAFDAKRFGEAADEFEAAYRLSPAFVVLYNIGQVSVSLGRSIEAVDVFERYLRQGASAIPPERRRQVEAEVERQRGRIGTLSIRTPSDGAEIRVDGAMVGKTPLGEPIRVIAGRHIIEAQLAEHWPQIREIDVAGRAEVVLELRFDGGAAVAPPAPVTPIPVSGVSSTPRPLPAPQGEGSVPPSSSGGLPQRDSMASVGPSIERYYIESSRPVAPPAPSDSSLAWQRIAGLAIMVTGVGFATWGGILAYRGATQSNDARDRLSQATPDTTDEVWNRNLADFNAGKSISQQGWITAGVGAGALVGGIILIATTPDNRTNVALAPWMTARSGGLVTNCVF